MDAPAHRRERATHCRSPQGLPQVTMKQRAERVDVGRSRLKQRAVLLVRGLVCAVAVLSAAGPAKALVVERTTVIYPFSSPYYPVVLTGKDLPPLLNHPLKALALYALEAGELRPIPFQIDRRDGDGAFQIPAGDAEQAAEAEAMLDGNDEWVFMASDVGEKTAHLPEALGASGGAEIELRDPHTGRRGWVYGLVFPNGPPQAAPIDYVAYDRGRDAIESDTVRIGFSREKPFLIDTILWKESETRRYARNFTDTMKIRHRGRLLKALPFERTQGDYTSQVTAVKDGPVRVIRRTSNKVRVLWRLKTPTIVIDFIHYANAFFMDTRLDLPFKPGLFFSDVETVMSLDGRPDPDLPVTEVFTHSLREGVPIDGTMSDRKKLLNFSTDNALVLANTFGKILVSLEVERGSPIRARPYLMDDIGVADPPENIPGQFGNVGFLSTGWDRLDSAAHHLVVSVYMIRTITVDDAFRMLRHAPSFMR